MWFIFAWFLNVSLWSPGDLTDWLTVSLRPPVACYFPIPDFSIWLVWSYMHMPAHMPLVWCMQKIARATSVYDTYCLGHWNEENERKIKNIKLNGWSFFFNLC